MTTLFISDLHLEANRPDIGTQFLEFLGADATEAEALYILGDLFEAWIAVFRCTSCTATATS
jgi:UDP-2,3-diacylglucosamine hydrolase